MEIQIQNRQRRFPVEKKRLSGWLCELMSQLDLENAEVSLLLVGNNKIKQLNQTYRKENRPTDVLAFPLRDGKAPPIPGLPIHLGDIVISVEKAAAQALEKGHSLDRELAVLIIHGLLHLVGYDHDSARRTAQMRSLETELLVRLFPE